MTNLDEIVEDLHNALTTVETLEAVSEGRSLAIHFEEVYRAMHRAYDELTDRRDAA